MGLFDKKTKNEIKDQLSFKEKWAIPRERAKIKLGSWGIFMGAIVLFVAIGARLPKMNSTPKKDDIIKFVDIALMQEEIIKANYSYEYDLTVEGIRYYYKGDKFENKNLGYKETEAGVIKYYVEDDKTYSLSLDKAELIENLYEDIPLNNLDLIKIFNSFIVIPTISEDGETRELTYKNGSMSLTINTDLKHITKIVLNLEDNIYSFSYDNINKVEAIIKPESLPEDIPES